MKNAITLINEDLRHFIKYGILISLLLISILIIKRIWMPYRWHLFVFVMNVLCSLLVPILATVEIRKKIQSITFLNLFVLNFLAISMVLFTIILYALFTGAFDKYYPLYIHVEGVLLLLSMGAILSLVVTYIARRLTRGSADPNRGA